jgi:hypothetical protein
MKMKMKYAFVPAGAYAGLPAVWITPGGSTETNIADAIETVTQILDTMNMHTRLIVFDAREEDFPEDDMASLIRLIDWALNTSKVIHYLSGASRPPYTRMGGTTKVFIEDDDWLRYPCNELYWRPSSKEATEPALEGFEAIPKYLVPDKLSLRWAIEFIGDCEKTWALAQRPKKEVEIALYG